MMHGQKNVKDVDVTWWFLCGQEKNTDGCTARFLWNTGIYLQALHDVISQKAIIFPLTAARSQNFME